VRIKRRRVGTFSVLVIAASWFAGVFFALGMSTRSLAESADVKVMSFNVRFANPGHSEEAAENNWNDSAHPRKARVIRVIRDYMPDLLGVQEARDGQINDLRAALPECEFYGIGRDDGKMAGEYSGIFYRKDRFKCVDQGSFWLSTEPEKPGTSFYTDPKAVPRIASWVMLDDRKTGRRYLMLNSHWDHISEPAREQSAALIRKRIASFARTMPTIVTGDFNSQEDTPAAAEIRGDHDPTGVQLKDSYRVLHPERTPEEASFNSWKGNTKGSRIDFILFSGEFETTAAEILRTSYDGWWPSDHYPVTATLRIEVERE
jgi:endonuclease/exonuclease/phosphatase family metal-dependent hydrolase